MIFYLWKQLNPNSHINQYESDITDIFGSHINLQTSSIAKIFQIVGFKFRCFFKILILENNTDNNNKFYHFDHCSCSESKNTKLLFTNKIYLSQMSHTFVVSENIIYVSKNEIYGRTTLQNLNNSYLTSTLPPNKNLVFFYSYCKHQIYCIINNGNNDDQYFSVEILIDKYLITPIDKPNYINNFHLTCDTVLPFLSKKGKKKSPSQLCLCFIEEKNFISLRPLGYKELKTNIQIMLHSMNLYVQFKPIFLFLSRLKMITYDIETQYR